MSVPGRVAVGLSLAPPRIVALLPEHVPEVQETARRRLVKHFQELVTIGSPTLDPRRARATPRVRVRAIDKQRRSRRARGFAEPLVVVGAAGAGGTDVEPSARILALGRR